MICKTTLSNLFQNMTVTDQFIRSLIGMPITDNGKRIGVIIGTKPETNELYLDIDDCYKSRFETNYRSSVEIITDSH